MKNYKLQRLAQSIIDELIQEIENLELDLEGKKREIADKDKRIEELEDEISGLYTENIGEGKDII